MKTATCNENNNDNNDNHADYNEVYTDDFEQYDGVELRVRS
jgi:hypothetical protein